MYIKRGIKYAKLSKLPWRQTVKEKVIHTPGKAFELINKQLEKSCHQPEKEIEVSYLSDECDTEAINSVTADELLDSLETSY